MKKFINIFMLVLFVSLLNAKIPRVFVSIKQKDIKAGDKIEILIGAEAEKGSKFKLPKIDEIGGFKVLSKKGLITYRVIEKDNKKISLVKRAVFYIIKPEKSFDIDSYTIKIDKKEFKTVPFKVNVNTIKKVEKKSSKIVKVESINSKKEESKKNIDSGIKTENLVDNNNSKSSIDNNFIFKLSSSKKDVVVGESFIVKVELIEPINLSSQDLQYFPPKFDGFKFQPIGDGKIEEKTNSVIRTIEYLVTPIKAGNHTISPARAKVGIQLAPQGQSPFGFFGTDVEWKKLSTNKLTFNVKEVPNGIDLVGKFKLETIIDSTNAKPNKPYSYTLKITGLGDLDDYEAPKININNITTYSEDADIKHIMTKGVVITRFVKKYTFISDKDFKIPSIKIKIYNPETKKIYILKSREINVKIKKLNSITSILSSKEPTKIENQNHNLVNKKVLTVDKQKPIVKESKFQEIKKVEDLLFDKNYYKHKFTKGYSLNAIFGALLLGIILGAGAVILLPGIARVSKKGIVKNKLFNSYEEALNILYPHTTKSRAIEDMVTKLYEVTNGNKEVKIDDYALNKMIKKIKNN